MATKASALMRAALKASLASRAAAAAASRAAAMASRSARAAGAAADVARAARLCSDRSNRRFPTSADYEQLADDFKTPTDKDLESDEAVSHIDERDPFILEVDYNLLKDLKKSEACRAAKDATVDGSKTPTDKDLESDEVVSHFDERDPFIREVDITC